MSLMRKFFLIFIFFVFDMFLLVGFLVIRDATNLNYLKKEEAILKEMNFSSDSYDLSIKSSGEFGVAEKYIKTYLNDYALQFQDTFTFIQDEKFTGLLSYDHYIQEDFYFLDSIFYLKSVQNRFNYNIRSLIKKSSDDSIRSYVLDSSYSSKLFYDFMSDEKMRLKFYESKNNLVYYSNQINNLFNECYYVLSFLNTYQEQWVLEDGEIKFANDQLLNQYLESIQRIKNYSYL